MKPAIVIDSSIALSWFFPDEGTPASAGVLDIVEQEVVAVPSHWRLEVTNVLALAERRGRTRSDLVDRFLRRLEDFQIAVVDQEPEFFTGVLALARARQLTTYDAAYLHLALTQGCPLATLDRQLREVSASKGVKLLGL